MVADAFWSPKGLQTVHKRLQSVAKRKKSEIQCPGVPPPFPYKLREQITSNVDRGNSTAAPKKIEIGHGPLALTLFSSACDEYGASYCSLE
jgi:hypothetical protein